MRIISKRERSTKYFRLAVLFFIAGILLLFSGIWLSDKITNGFALEYIGVFSCFFMWIYAVHCLYKAHNIVIINDDNIKVIRSPFFYMFDGDVTLRQNKNKQLEIDDILYITHIFGVDGIKIGDTFVILSNFPPEEDYTVHDDQNAVVIYSDEEIIDALKENFDYIEVNNLRSVVLEKGLYRIETTPEREGGRVRKVMLRSPEDFALWFVLTVIPGALFSFAPEDEMDYFVATLMIGIVITFIVYGCAYIIATEEYISEIYFPYIPIKRIYFSDCAEIGMFTARFSGKQTNYVDYFYFSPRILSEEERANIQGLPETDYKKIPHTEKLHTFLTDTLGIELKGKLMDRKK